MAMYNGILNVYKEKDFTSHDVVAKLRGILHQKKIGHTGTLDPNAVGVLPICLGKGTKLCEMLTDKDKTYVALMQLGIKTDTQDMTGSIVEKRDVNISREQIETAVMSFVGQYDQLPPMYSAIKVDGRRLYEMAREGKEVRRKPRKITIHNIKIINIDIPMVEFEVSCSKGTYIRTLCEDIGERLGCPACMSELTRTKVSGFEIKDALRLSEIEELVSHDEIEKYITPLEAVFSSLKRANVLPQYDKLLYNGNALCKKCFSTNIEYDRIAVYDSNNNFTAVYIYRKDKNYYSPEKMFI